MTHSRATAILALVAFVMAFVVFPVPHAAAQSATPSLARAQDLFHIAEFSAALDEVNALLRSGTVSGTSLRDAYVIEARCHVALGQRDDAQRAYCRALGVDRVWTPDADFFTRDEIDTFDRAKATCGVPEAPEQSADAGEASTAWYKKPIVLGAAAGAAVIGLIAILAGGGGGDGAGDGDGNGDVTPLPDFPPPPGP